MTRGAVIFARNNEHIDYVAMAHWSARNIERHLGIPTHIITDDTVAGNNSRHFSDVGTVTWHNLNRMDVYELSPWEETLVLDADYVVATDQLNVLFESSADFLAHRWAYDITGLSDFAGLNWFGQHRMPQWWATVMFFRRSEHTQLIFEMMSMIRNNWNHYRQLYRNNSPSYRNDHALSIALNTVNGHDPNHAGIPWRLASVTPEHQLTQLDQDCYRVDYTMPDGQRRWINIAQDFHAMGKQQLGAIVANNT